VALRRMSVSQVALLAIVCLIAGLLLLLAGIETRELAYFLGALFLVNSVCISIAYPSLTILSLTDVPSARAGYCGRRAISHLFHRNQV